MDFYEDVVEFYLTAIEGCAVIPQAPILKNKDGENWEAFPDFIAINFAERRVEIVEVAKSAYAAPVKRLAEKLLPSHREHVEHYVLNTTFAGQLQVPIHWRFFVRQKQEATLRAQEAFRGFDPNRVLVTTLEDVFDELRDKMP
jgi:hypothetical protein